MMNFPEVVVEFIPRSGIGSHTRKGYRKSLLEVVPEVIPGSGTGRHYPKWCRKLFGQTKKPRTPVWSGQTYGLRRRVTHTDVCSLCATRNRMRAPLAPPIFHTYEKYL